MPLKQGEVSPRHMSAHPKRNGRIVTTLTGALRVVHAPKGARVQGVSRKEWRKVVRIVGKEG